MKLLPKITPEDSKLILNGTTFKGMDESKNAFNQLFVIYNDRHNQIDAVTIEERIIYITWYFTPIEKSKYFGTDTFVVENGKISTQTIGSSFYELFPVRKE